MRSKRWIVPALVALAAGLALRNARAVGDGEFFGSLERGARAVPAIAGRGGQLLVANRETKPDFDYSGEDGMSSFIRGDDGGDGKDLIVELSADPARTKLTVAVTEAGRPFDSAQGRPASRVVKEFALPLPEGRLVLIRSRGGAGGRGGDVFCSGQYDFRRPGDGGDGGDGGQVTLRSSSPELQKLVTIDMKGGAGGMGGFASGCMGPTIGFSGHDGKAGSVVTAGTRRG